MQALAVRKTRILRPANCPHFHAFCGWGGDKSVDDGRVARDLRAADIEALEPGGDAGSGLS